mmetsp:Transcript_5958/g.9196  ORF Transcript_5958/g.9196 Transcript_5958/m.9196 type:complete len:167 (-) Transcript_5958:508-1008(-)|eukprot:CAMPEP_0195286034 /NCGR_PEP_ID=MMETSP0707-20130614/3647_1 /TAXON_ID=33640 /ORGANISM="Asterionellopsis glacialis, Strain CCMP134" /LENGTH=166 /DNA_ID=CAMNT_0040345625 /DNA_START=67 /DNA_END=567 /DNA_ORIENTATION=-
MITSSTAFLNFQRSAALMFVLLVDFGRASERLLIPRYSPTVAPVVPLQPTESLFPPNAPVTPSQPATTSFPTVHVTEVIFPSEYPTAVVASPMTKVTLPPSVLTTPTTTLLEVDRINESTAFESESPSPKTSKANSIIIHVLIALCLLMFAVYTFCFCQSLGCWHM